MAGGGERHVYALDFDGVICDSCGESSRSAVIAAQELWPDVFERMTDSQKETILEQMRTVRPVVETGYENVILVRLLYEALCDGKDVVKDILADWPTIKTAAMQRLSLERESLVHLFGSVRDRWISSDIDTWLSANRIYPGVADALRFASSEVYIVTTKQRRFAIALLERLAGIGDFPEERVYDLEAGPKVEVLKRLQLEHPGHVLHFVEDRLVTLENVIKDPALDGWKLYLGTWGYNTHVERERARANTRITVIDLPEFKLI
eukprot:jgi/Chlat1/3754/Chrsp259S03899